MIYGTSGNALFGKEDELRRILELAQKQQLNPDISFRANPANYRNNPRGNFVGDVALTAAELGGAAHGKYLNAVNPLIRDTTYSAGKGARGVAKALGAKPKVAASAGRMAMQALKNPAMQVGMRYLPVAGTVLSVGDLILGDESLANKGMDAALMAAGGALGSVVPVVGTAIGVGGGKLISDGIQYLFGGGKSPEERRMEQQQQGFNAGAALVGSIGGLPGAVLGGMR